MGMAETDIEKQDIKVEVVTTAEPWYKRFRRFILSGLAIIASVFAVIATSSAKTETKEQKAKDKQLKAKSESIAKKVAELEKHSAEMDKAIEAKKAAMKVDAEKTSDEAKKFAIKKEDIVAGSNNTQSNMDWVMQRFGGEVKRN